MRIARGVMETTIRDRLQRAQAARFFGRERELAELESRLADDQGPAVVYVHGIGGIGKTSLLDALERRVKGTGLVLMRFDCHAVEPTPRGMLHALAERVARELASVDAAARALGNLDGRIVLVFDDYQSFRLLDAWLRQVFIPALPGDVRVLLVSREGPAEGWTMAPGWRGLLHVLTVGPLDDVAVAGLLASERVPADAAKRIRQFARGHPLAVRLAATRHAGSTDQAVESGQVLPALARRFLEDVDDSDTRRAVEAGAVLRRMTRSLLAALLGTDQPDAFIERLRELPFVTQAQDGLVIHEVVRSALAQSLRAIDPQRYQDLRRRGWDCLRREVTSLGRVQLWRYTADILYLVEQPSIREAFFPADIPQRVVEPARPEDQAAIGEITQQHDGPEGARAVSAWWRELPECFAVVRGAAGEVLAYSILAFAADVGERIAGSDPVAASWLADIQKANLPGDRPVLLSRRLLTRDTGEGPSFERAACFLDIKRTYLENPNACRIYAAMRLDHERLAIFDPLGFRVLDHLAIEQDGRPLDTLMLEFGPEGIPGWIARLIDAQYDAPAVQFGLDASSRALMVDGTVAPLTRLEFAVMRYLSDHSGRVVTRDEMLQEVWKQPFAGSNVVDTLIRALRKKLGSEAPALETVKGHGYRFRGFRPEGH